MLHLVYWARPWEFSLLARFSDSITAVIGLAPVSGQRQPVDPFVAAIFSFLGLV